MNKIRVRVRNKTFTVKDCKGISSIKGLMFDRLEDKDGALIYANNIWMPFVKKNLNLIFLDGGMKVIDQKIATPMKLDRKTWKTYSNKGARYCLELKHTSLRVPKGTSIKIL